MMPITRRHIVCALVLFVWSVGSRYSEAQDVQRPTVPDSELLRGQIYHPQFSPSNPFLIAYERQVEDVQELYLLDQRTGRLDRVETRDSDEGQEGVLLSSLLGSDSGQAYSRYEGYMDWRPVQDAAGRQWFIFVSGAAHDMDLYLSYVDAEGKLAAEPALRLGRPGTELHPRWSPDGGRLAFVGDGEAGSDLFIAENMQAVLEERDPGLFRPVRVTQNRGPDTHPAWSPDGQYLAYESMQEEEGAPNWGINAVYVGHPIDAPLRPVRLTSTGDLRRREERKPSWSQDGRFIAYYVSQAYVGQGGDNKLQDIDVLAVVHGADGRIEGGVPIRGDRVRIAENVVPHDKRGPAWSTMRMQDGEETQVLFYVKKDEARGNPIYLSDVASWERGLVAEVNLSDRADFDTQLHREPLATPLPAGMRLAFVAHEQGANQLTFRDIGRDPHRLTYLAETSRRAAVTRSLMVPGWGQAYNGQRRRARVFAAVGSVALAGTAYNQWRYSNEASEVRKARRLNRSLDRLQEERDERAFWKSIRTASVATLLGFWTVNVLDSYLSGGRPVRRAVQVAGLHVPMPDVHLVYRDLDDTGPTRLAVSWNLRVRF